MSMTSSTNGQRSADPADCDGRLQPKRPWTTPTVIVTATHFTGEPYFLPNATEQSSNHIGFLTAGPS
jgi:hypothetical protein